MGALPLLFSALILGSHAALALAADGVFARNGKGEPVSWFVVYKLPMLARTGEAVVSPTPCDCAPPNCSQLATEALDVRARASGLCYLYADATNATLRHFRELGYDCLGQGGDDPVSHTLRHIQPTSGRAPARYWAVYNDQLNGIAESYVPPAPLPPPPLAPVRVQEKERDRIGQRICSGSDLFSAHAKGAVAFDGVDGGFVLQTSTPNFPDPSNVAAERVDKLVPLGCQKDNNVHFAQHMVGLSLGMEALNQVGKQLQAARLCSGNFFGDLRTALASEQLLQDGGDPQKNGNFSELYRALLDASLQEVDVSPTANVQLRGPPSQSIGRAKVVFSPLQEGESLTSIAGQDAAAAAAAATITVTVKTPRAAVPPWALLAEVLASDLSVATWWDGSYGIPNICAGDVYANASEKFCLDAAGHGVQLNRNGTAKFNVENLIEAAWQLPNTTDRTFWHLVGGSKRDGNHAKWGVSTPRFGSLLSSSSSSSSQQLTTTFGDLNMEGYPCSTTCHGSQAGRGGSFFTFDLPRLHASFVGSLIAKACPCVSPKDARTNATDASFSTLRMCKMGCWRKVDAHFNASQLPVMTSDVASFWDRTDE